MSLEFRVASGCEKTGNLLRQLVGSAHGTKTGVVCWGVGHNGVEPALNARASACNKLQQLQKFKDAGILTVPFFTRLPSAAEDFPVLGRNFKHHGGTDIKLIMEPEMAEIFSKSDFYTRYVPRATEYRCWVYRRRHLATYQKRLVRPEEALRRNRVGANHRNGYAFLLMNSALVPDGLREIAAKACDCLGLDFGAVDVLKGVDGAFYVLELNTAPGAESADRAGLKSLAEKIQNWQKLGCPRRNGEGRPEGKLE
jgi:glutathione synthase/RimK-type ligase-like ATP-grasp enzyme